MTPAQSRQDEKEQLLAEIHKLRQQVRNLQQSNRDLQIALETTAIHGDFIEEQLHEANQQLQAAIAGYQQKQIALQRVLDSLARQKADLEMILHMTIEHGDTIENELYGLTQKLETEVHERKQAEAQLQTLLQVISKERNDLEIVMQTIIEHGDAIEIQWFNKVTEANFLATRDSLTQLANRRKLDEYLAHEWMRTGREQLPLSLILCDIDYFKPYNDSYGHPLGDEALKKVAHAIARVVTRSSDLVARYGGEEFAIVLPNTPEAGAKLVAERIRQEVEKLQIPHEFSSVSCYVTISLGIATIYPTLDVSLNHLLATADKALYKAKKHGRNCVVYQSGYSDDC